MSEPETQVEQIVHVDGIQSKQAKRDESEPETTTSLEPKKDLKTNLETPLSSLNEVGKDAAGENEHLPNETSVNDNRQAGVNPTIAGSEKEIHPESTLSTPNLTEETEDEKENLDLDVGIPTNEPPADKADENKELDGLLDELLQDGEPMKNETNPQTMNGDVEDAETELPKEPELLDEAKNGAEEEPNKREPEMVESGKTLVINTTKNDGKVNSQNSALLPEAKSVKIVEDEPVKDSKALPEESLQTNGRLDPASDASGANTKTDEEKGEVSENAAGEDSCHHERKNSLVGLPVTVSEDNSDEEIEDVKEERDDNPWMTKDSDIKNPKRRIFVVTTAALPWRTGTAVNPLLRALYLTRGRPKHYVTLVIPWCNDEQDRLLTLGKDHKFSNKEEQEKWIRDFCRTRAGCKEEEKNLRIMFYESKYNEGFGSIFPSVDICSLIPDEDADVAILEEPEHLNWLRVPKPYKAPEDQFKQNNESKVQDGATAKEKAELGWRFKFRHVVGIIHTNYKAYAEQYGVGGKVITAPALCALNALVVRAYCHRVILLSGTLPSLTPYKEVTCNVHGVRGEFLDRSEKGRAESKEDLEEDDRPAPVYFIGKLIWAKGFDKVLDLQNLYREKHNDHFPIDIYGAGGDEKAIKRAFFGRIPQIQRSGSPESDECPEPPPKVAAEVFTWKTSLRSHLVEDAPFTESEKHDAFDASMDNITKRLSQRDLGVDVNDEQLKDGEESGTEQQKVPNKENTAKKRTSLIEDLSEKVVPISVIGDLSMKTLDTTKAITGAAVTVAQNVVNAGLNVTFTSEAGSPRRRREKKVDVDGDNSKPGKQKLIFDPPQSVFEFRRNPISARFLGTKDHVLVRDIPEHKVFLNMSITEVLCTTSAEALAMGKFVILPRHPSNAFFYQFPNCLPYESLHECLEKLEWALQNEPKPLNDESALKLSWEGANQRLFESSAITKDEWEEWQETGKTKSDDDAARFHVETGMRGHLIGKFFTRDKPDQEKTTGSTLAP